MLIDKQLVVSDAQAITADAYSTNTIDLGSSNPERQIGDGEPMALVVCCDVALAGTSPTLVVNLVESANADLSSHAVILASKSYSALAAGDRIVIPLPPGSPVERYVGAYYDVGGTSPTVTLTSFVQPLSMVEKRKDYASGFSVG